MVGRPLAFARFQLKFILLAPSESPVKLIGRVVGVVVRLPFASKASVPVRPVPPVAAPAGSAML